MKKVLLAGGAGMGNLGDEALILAVVQKLQKMDPTIQITVATPNADITGWTMPDIATVPSPRTAFFGAHSGGGYYDVTPAFQAHWHALAEAGTRIGPMARSYRRPGQLVSKILRRLKPWEPMFFDPEGARAFMAAFEAADAVIVYGGGILTTATRSRLWEMALLARMCQAAGKPILLRGHQIGPIDNDTDAARLKEIAEIAGFIGVRDIGVSAPECARITGRTPVEAIDDAFFTKLPDVEAPEGAPALPERYIAVGYRGIKNEPPAFRAAFAKMVTEASDRLDCPVVYVPQGAFDLDDLRDLQARVDRPGFVVGFDGLSWYPFKVLSNATLAITLPHHSVVFALKGNVPIISPVCGTYYAAKNVGSMRNFGVEDYVLVYDEAPETFEARGQALLDRVLPQIETLRAEFTAARDGFTARGDAFDAAFFKLI